MKLNITVDGRTQTIDVPDNMLTEAGEFFRKMDRDMDAGWRMGPEFVENPDRVNRCQIAADKLLVSLSTGNHTLTQLMAAYILLRLPGVIGVDIDTGGEMLNTEFSFAGKNSGDAAQQPAKTSG
jgi:hypothetical protein